ncbi:putative CPW-WPC domain protein [Gregarina niphandrodes]|uniref:CPW-WPC domain protein n=1 Tax=Gregarina niphandrodes TaxID=110365 RepID=A0A023BCS4_GRENI|nr:putative CPW-WPC domain protein [Gregarina niphandrodes]EZG86212.1 putative CPW-WPC domain protein [Gregarina niphandrodes]|eukprot:XP_011128780.1 putative CPW-WPC domain protein [Gregarina niphandrodes]
MDELMEASGLEIPAVVSELVEAETTLSPSVTDPDRMDFCDRDHIYGCPLGWLPKKSNPVKVSDCVPPVDQLLASEQLVKQLPEDPMLEGQKQPCVVTRCATDDVRYPLYTQPCPENWTFDGSTCTSPGEYDGPCIGSFSFPSITTKETFAVVCNAPWSCEWLPPCESCPWRYTAKDGICKTPRLGETLGRETAASDESAVDARCDQIDSSATRQEREDFQSVCGPLAFVCVSRDDCKRDYSSCPMGSLTLGPHVCFFNDPVADESGCPRVLDLLELDQTTKANLAARCGLTFPCLRDTTKDEEILKANGISETSNTPAIPYGPRKWRQTSQAVLSQE